MAFKSLSASDEKDARGDTAVAEFEIFSSMCESHVQNHGNNPARIPELVEPV